MNWVSSWLFGRKMQIQGPDKVAMLLADMEEWPMAQQIGAMRALLITDARHLQHSAVNRWVAKHAAMVCECYEAGGLNKYEPKDD